ncbi:putative Senescence-associated21 [Tripterygium wilfordii]|uniref:Putative Senescence-associated21 n=1 Tax=Tripterygium wilfordii TaxID=458696 RepID=A0A7J7CEE5_TRIWF|nr:uncharacterized protein LOC119983467 [Tripterygium wilfordii]KAF5732086.1 putative Senescence-associated21 [Tripterygium wilfordii]
MAKLLDNCFHFIRRSYSVAAENMRMQPPPAAMRKVGDLGAGFTAKSEEIYWMKDPKTGNWVPESHFDEVDVAELRDKLLPKKVKR